MKRTALGVLILSMVALPMFAGDASQRKSPLTAARCLSLEHIPGGWRMEIKCDQGKGVITLLDAGKQKQYLGSGMFLNRSQEEMKSVYRSLLPNDESGFELMQLG
jgi:hypothetical protein